MRPALPDKLGEDVWQPARCSKRYSVLRRTRVFFGKKVEGPGMQANASSRGSRVLVAEDEAVVALMIEELLTESGFVVIGPVASTMAGLALVEQEVIDCAVLDIKLTDGISLPVAEALAARGIPFVITTGYERESIHPGYNGAPVLTKVFLPHELLDAIAEALRPYDLVTAAPHDRCATGEQDWLQSVQRLLMNDQCEALTRLQ
jgi:DNA-binding response OmpR family regulator